MNRLFARWGPTLATVATLAFAAHGQTHKADVKADIKKAEEYMRYEEYRSALPIWEQLVSARPNDPNANFQIGICYLGLGRGSEAYSHLIKAKDGYGEMDPTIHLLIGRSQKQDGKFDEAVTSFEKYANGLTRDKIEERAEVQRQIKECKVGATLVANPVKCTITNLGGIVNTRFAEYVPVISADNAVMYFTSRREGSIGGDMDEKDNYYEDVYMTQNNGGAWTQPANLGNPVNGSTHDACIALSPDGQTLFIYKDEGEGNIYLSSKKGNEWTKPRSIGANINTKQYREPSVSITADGKTLFFSSNRPGGFGGLDIWVSQKQSDGEWGPAANMGSAVNTTEDEDAPFIHPDGVTFYYSSKGHETMGGFDIFRSIKERGEEFSAPENLGYPINTAGDDIYFVLSADGLNGYYASEKPGGQGFTDIYRVSMPGPEVLDTVETRGIAITDGRRHRGGSNARFVTPVILVKGVVKDEKTGLPIPAKITVTDNATGKTVQESETNSASGEYLLVLPKGKNYGITVESKGFLFNSDNFTLPDSGSFKEFRRDISMKKAEAGAKVALRNIFFNTNLANLRTESTTELDRLYNLMVDMPELKLEISGHTDNRGSATLNQSLSEARAKAVVEYLAKKGAAKERLVYKGYAFAHPVASNDDEEGRQLNRRTEFEVQ